MFLKRFVAGALIILACGLSFGFVFWLEIQREYANASKHYVSARQAEALTAVKRVDEAFRGVYENLRTLSLLPSVRKIDRHASNLDGDGRGALQQIYNNLASSVEVSEVYIVPASFNPSRLDPVTGKLEEPILMFDQLIVNAGKFASVEDPFAAHAASDHAESAEDEVETEEYQQLVEQIAWLKRNNVAANSTNSLHVPMISGPEVLTCDNTVYVKTLRDADRMGFIFSVPFFDQDGKLKGLISAIIRSGALRAILPGEQFALHNAAYDAVLPAGTAGQANSSVRSIAEGVPDPGLIYSAVYPLTARDPRATWSLWVGYPNSTFYGSAEIAALKRFERVGYSMILALAVSALIFWVLVLRKQLANAQLERSAAERAAEMHHMALHDSLTGLPNRVLLRQKLDEAMPRARRGETIAILWLDLDHFKNVNDSLGHPVGDSLLKSVAVKIQECIRSTDTAARVGGDEFVILQTSLSSPQDSAVLAQRLIDSLGEPIAVDDQQVVVGASVGISVANGEDAETLLRNADIALYRAKLEGRGTFRFFEPGMDAIVKERRRLEMGLRNALAADEFVLHYQPLVDAKTQKITGFEALLRWNDPAKGMISPTVFIPIAEEIGIIGAIGEWVLQRACSDAATWPSHLRVAVNLSAVQFKQQTLGLTVAKALEQSGLPPNRLELEITESVLMSANESTLALLHQLRNMGIRIAMDDFGTGYSSLSYLQSFPFDKIKIDRSFVAPKSDTTANTAIIKAIVAMGTSLGMSTTAEGVETAEQLDQVRDHGCTELQGYLFSRPLPLAEVKKLLEERPLAVA